MFFPTAGIELNPLILVLLGLTVGVCSGFLGVGGSFIITPALNIFGFPMAAAIGTGLAQVLGTSVIGTLKHRKLGNVDFKLGLILVLSAIPGVEIGKSLLLYLDGLGLAGSVVRYVYIALLGGFGAYMLWESYRASTRKAASNHKAAAAPIPRRINLPPLISLPRSGIGSLSLWILVALGFAVGLLSGFLGVGGGFIMIPVMIYLVGIPTMMAVGTSLFTIVLGSGAYGAFTYARANHTDVMAALVMLAGASLGAQIGATATKYAQGTRLRLYFALTVLFTAVSIILKQASTRPGLGYLGDYAAYLLLAVAIGMSLLITALLVSGKLRGLRGGA